MVKQITIKNNIYKSAFRGTPIKVPTFIEYGITESDFKNKIEYDSLMSNYEKKIEDISFVKIPIAIGIIIFIMEIGYIISLNTHDFRHSLAEANFIYIIGYTISFIIIAYPAVLLQGTIICMPIPNKLLISISKCFLEKPRQIAKHKEAEEYQKAIIKFDSSASLLKNKYYNIEHYNYNLHEYGCDILNEFIEKIIKFTNMQNDIIKKENLRQYEQYWYDLDPFEFENEVAHWFSLKGYKATVTKKTGDQGIDIIINKDNYIGYVQCKRYTISKVDRPTLNALYGVVCADKVNQGIVVCLEGVTNEAKEFAKKVNIKIFTIKDLAPEENLFHHKIIKNTLSVQVEKINDFWCKIGNFYVNTNIYKEKSDLDKIIEKWENKGQYHGVNYKNIFFNISSSEDNFEMFHKWFTNEIQHPKRMYSCYKKRKRGKKYY